MQIFLGITVMGYTFHCVVLFKIIVTIDITVIMPI